MAAQSQDFPGPAFKGGSYTGVRVWRRVQAGAIIESLSPFDRRAKESRAYRYALVETLRRDGHLRSARVADALLAVPREAFVPELPLEDVYRPSEAIVIKRVDGVSVSSASAPEVIALMLQQLDPRPGDHILEIGAGSGYNAALLAHLVGESGRVVSLDIDEDLVLSARSHLAAAGYPNVSVVQADGALGYPAERRYDGIILTVASNDLPPAWYEQLARPLGRLVMPLALRTLQRCLVFEPVPDDDACLVSRSLRACSFISLRGLLGGGSPRVPLDQDGSSVIVVDQEALSLYPQQITGLLSRPLRSVPTGVSASLDEMRAGIHLWLVAHEQNIVTVWAASRMPDLFGLAEQAGARGTIGLVDPREPGLALLAWSGSTAPGGELRTIAPVGSEAVAERLRSLVLEWSKSQRPTDQEATVLACLDASRNGHAGHGETTAIEQRWTRFELSWSSRRRS